MKRLAIGSIIVLVFTVSVVSLGFSQKDYHEKIWIQGRVIGNTHGKVVTLELVDLNGNYQTETSTNKYGWYSFSAMNRGNPSGYKLIVYLGDQKVKTVSLRGVKPYGRVPDIKLK